MKQTTVATYLVLSCWITVPTAQQPEPAHNVFVMTGCLERGTAPSAFRLTRAAPVGQTPPPPTTSSATDADVYELQATSSVSELGLSSERLQPEVGTRVQMTIRPVEAAPTSSASSRSASENTREKPAESPRPRYTVIAIERIADSCK